jgi:hypothetical protein
LLCSQERQNREGLAASRRVGYNSELAVNELLLAIISVEHDTLVLLHGVQKAVLMRAKLCTDKGILKGLGSWEIMKKYFIE